jgi:hypothetical protein
VTANVDVGGADGVKTSYFYVELSQDSEDESMYFYVGMFRPGLYHGSGVYLRPGDGWALNTKTGGRFRYDGPSIDRQGRLKVGDRAGVLLDLE